MVKILEQRYNSTGGFITQNKLEDKAIAYWGKDWEEEDDVNQILDMLTHLGRTDLQVALIAGLNQDDIEVSAIEIQKITVNFTEGDIEEMREAVHRAGENTRHVFDWTIDNVEVEITVGDDKEE